MCLAATGSVQQFDVYRVPVEALLLNVENRRFKTERTLMEEQLQRSLDAENNPDDERSVVSILLDSGLHVEDGIVTGSPSQDYESLRKDWLSRKQENPFWIRPDGTVRNGNRRLAMIKRLQGEFGRDGYEFVDAMVIRPEEIDELELFKMEQREQLTQNYKVQYTDINRLLALREAAEAFEIDWGSADDLDRVAGELQHLAGGAGDKQYAAVQLQAIRAMDAYLADSRQEGQYHKLMRQVERFRDVGKIMALMQSEYSDNAPDMLKILFAAIRAGSPHGNIRWLRKIFLADRSRFARLQEMIEEAERPWASATAEQLSDPDLSILDAEEGEAEDLDDVDPPGPVVPNYPGGFVQTAIRNAIDAYGASSNDDVASVLDQVTNRQADLRLFLADCGRLFARTAWRPHHNVKQTVTDIFNWVRAHEKELRPLV